MTPIDHLGTFTASGLRFLISEQILSSQPLATDYSWDLYNDSEVGGEEEVITTKKCVVWSQGGIVRRVCRFDHEEQIVTQAVLTWLPRINSDDIASRSKSSAPAFDSEESSKIARPRTTERQVLPLSSLSRALVVVIGDHANIYFLSGFNHIVKLPFEVERLFSAPRGLLLQRKIPASLPLPPTPQPPFVPPNSFAASQSWQPTLVGLGARSHTPNPRKTAKNLSDFVAAVDADTTDNLPCFLTLLDPLSELGQVLEAHTGVPRSYPISPHSSAYSSTPTTLFQAISRDEEVLYVSPKDELAGLDIDRQHPLILVLTLNRINQILTLWHGFYIESDPFAAEKPENRIQSTARPPRSKRRSSFAARLSTGKMTPAADAQDRLRNRPSGNFVPPTNSQMVSQHIPISLDGDIDPALAIASDMNEEVAADLGNRRQSSFLARAELSSQDPHAFVDLARIPPVTNGAYGSFGRRGPSFGSTKDRTSAGKFRHSGHLSTPTSNLGLSEVNEDREDLLASVMNEASVCEVGGFPEHRAQDTPAELVLLKVSMVPIGPHFGGAKNPADKNLKVFTIPSATLPGELPRKLNLYLHISQENKLLELRCHLHTADVTTSSGSSEKANQCQPNGSVDLQVHQDIIAVSRLSDHRWHRMLFIYNDPNKSKIAHLLTEKDIVEQSLSLQRSSGGLCLPGAALSSQLSQDVMAEAHAFLNQTKNGPDQPRIEHQTQSLLRIHAGNDGRFYVPHKGGVMLQYQVKLEPRDPKVTRLLLLCRYVLSGLSFGGLDVLSIFWRMSFETQHRENDAKEWLDLVTTIFVVVLSLCHQQGLSIKPSRPHIPTSQKTGSSSTIWQGSWLWARRQPKLIQLRGDSELDRCVERARFFLRKFGSGAVIVDSEATVSDVESLNNAIYRLTLGLHLVCEEQELDNSTNQLSNSSPRSLRAVVALINLYLSWSSKDSAVAAEPSEVAVYNRVLPEPSPPLPSILAFIERQFAHRSADSFPEITSLSVSKNADERSQKVVQQLNPRTTAINAFFKDISQVRSHSFLPVELMQKHGIDADFLSSLPEGIACHFQTHMLRASLSHDTHWSSSRLELKGRHGLLSISRSSVTSIDSEPTAFDITLRRKSGVRDLHGLVAPSSLKAITDEVNQELCPHAGNEVIEPIHRQIFRFDQRYGEAKKVVNPLAVPVVWVSPQTGMTEAESLERQRALAHLVYKRTMALSSGQAVLLFASLKPLATERLEMQTFQTTCNMQPSNNRITADKSNFTEDKVCWAFFHAGVDTGLRIAQDAPGIDTTWLVLNKPNDLGNRHAGFLLALGLNGHLKKMARWLAFKYLSPKHNMTSIGLLLGLAASYIGTMDTHITRLLSVHMACLLPPDSAELNLSGLVQAAGVMGIGLLYYNSQHRRMSEILISEIEHVDQEEQESFRDEGYRLAAGFALGLINLGCARNANNTIDIMTIERLLKVATGSRSVGVVPILDQATASATIALALLFLKSNNEAVARKIDIPSTARQFDYIRPDILLLRVVARNLIMWDDISNDHWTWLHVRTPIDLRREKSNAVETFNTVLADEPLSTSNLPLYNILSGLCWSIALKFAGSGSRNAVYVLTYYFDQIGHALASPGKSFDKLLARDALQRFRHLLALSMAIIMSGSGDLDVLKRLRILHADIHDKTFGFHQAAHVSIGILFMGRGKFAFMNSDLAIAALMIAFYPIFPNDVLDNRAHLQAFRHFWVFAAESRCLICRDVETYRLVIISISVQLCSGEELALTAPCLLPQIDTIHSIRITSPAYAPVVLDFVNNADHVALFRKHQTIFLRRISLLTQHPSSYDSSIALLKEDRYIATLPDRAHVLANWLYQLDSRTTGGVSRADFLEILPRRPLLDEQSNDILEITPIHALLDIKTTAFDDAMVFLADLMSCDEIKLTNLRLLLTDFVNMSPDSEHSWIRREWVEGLMVALMKRGQEQGMITNPADTRFDDGEMMIE